MNESPYIPANMFAPPGDDLLPRACRSAAAALRTARDNYCLAADRAGAARLAARDADKHYEQRLKDAAIAGKPADTVTDDCAALAATAEQAQRVKRLARIECEAKWADLVAALNEHRDAAISLAAAPADTAQAEAQTAAEAALDALADLDQALALRQWIDTITSEGTNTHLGPPTHRQPGAVHWTQADGTHRQLDRATLAAALRAAATAGQPRNRHHHAVAGFGR